MFIFFTSSIHKTVVITNISAPEAEITKLFIDKKLSKNGGIFTNYKPEKSTGNITKGHDILSESQGLYCI